MSQDYNPADVRAIVTSAGLLSSSDVNLIAILSDLLTEHRIDQTIYNEIMASLRKKILDYKSPQDLGALHSRTRQCRKCPSRLQPCELPVGNVRACKILFVIEKPFDEVNFDLFKQTMSKVNVNLDDVCLTYLTRCRGETVYDFEIDNCKFYLFDEIEILNPNLIVLMGLKVIETLYGTVNLKQQHGQKTVVGIYRYLLTYSLGYASYNENNYQRLLEDLSNLTGEAQNVNLSI